MIRQAEPLEPRSIVLTTDCGADMDDQWALAHLVLSPEFLLHGVVTTHAPNLAAPAAETAAYMADEVLDWLPFIVRPPVIVGANAPLSGHSPQLTLGADFILEQARDHTVDDRLVVLVLGAATDLASALLSDDSLGDRIEVIAMGFEGWPAGHDPFNVRNDVKAWQVLLDSRASITVGDAAVTSRRLAMTRQEARALLEDCGRAGPRLAALLGDWLDAHSELVRRVTGDAGSWPVWDEVVVAHLLGLTSSETYQRPRLQDDIVFDHREHRDQTITWITDIDASGLWLDLRQKLRRCAPLPGG